MGNDCRHSSVQVHGGTNAGAEPGNEADNGDEADGSDASEDEIAEEDEDDEDAMISSRAQR